MADLDCSLPGDLPFGWLVLLQCLGNPFEVPAELLYPYSYCTVAYEPEMNQQDSYRSFMCAY